jgi:hypothetical protein
VRQKRFRHIRQCKAREKKEKKSETLKYLLKYPGSQSPTHPYLVTYLFWSQERRKEKELKKKREK